MTASILIIDDSAIGRIELRACLRQSRFEVDAVGFQDLLDRKGQTRGADLVVFVSHEPSKNYAVQLKSIRKRIYANTPIVMICNEFAVDGVDAAFAAGAKDVLLAPASNFEVLARVRKALRSRARSIELSISNAALALSEAPQMQLSPETTNLVVAAADKAIAQSFAEELILPPHINPKITDFETALWAPIDRNKPTVLLLCLDEKRDNEEEAVNVFNDLRSRIEVNSAGIIAWAEKSMPLRARFKFLDLGADDIVIGKNQAGEASARIKHLADRLTREKSRALAIHDGLLLATKDPLTGLRNRRYVFNFLKRKMEETYPCITALAVDLDHFKSVNDKYGHATGDIVLQRCATVLESNLRVGDFCARVGGEEFLVILNTDNAGVADAAAKRLCQQIADVKFKLSKDEEFSVTASIGIAIWRDGISAEELLSDADQAMYRAKLAGRNAVRFHQLAA